MAHRVIKRGRHTEPYQRDKLQGSVHKICLSVHDFVGAAELTAEQVCNHVEAWLGNKTEITSSDIRQAAGQALKQYSPHAATLYQAHMDIN